MFKKTTKKKTPREQMKTEKKISDPQYRTKEIVQQELTSKIQNYQETIVLSITIGKMRFLL